MLHIFCNKKYEYSCVLIVLQTNKYKELSLCTLIVAAILVDLKIFFTGGKDSTVLAYIMKLLNDRYNYGLKLVLLSVDEGITGKTRWQEGQLRVGSVSNQVKDALGDVSCSGRVVCVCLLTV